MYGESWPMVEERNCSLTRILPYPEGQPEPRRRTGGCAERGSKRRFRDAMWRLTSRGRMQRAGDAGDGVRGKVQP